MTNITDDRLNNCGRSEAKVIYRSLMLYGMETVPLRERTMSKPS